MITGQALFAYVVFYTLFTYVSPVGLFILLLHVGCYVWMLYVQQRRRKFKTLTVFLLLLILIAGNLLYRNIPYLLDVLALKANVPELSCDRTGWTQDIVPECKTFTGYTATIEPRVPLCRENGGRIKLLVLVASRPSAHGLRDAIRSTWGRNATLLFTFGTSDYDSSLVAEAKRTDDILQHDFKESYYNLTLKSVLSITWVIRTQKCVDFVLKTDDDTYNNLQVIAQTTDELAVNEIGGYCFTTRPHRDPDDKFRLSKHAYPTDAYLPVYCNGPGYLMSTGSAAKLMQVAHTTRSVEMEDLFITGYCRYRADVRYRHLAGFGFTKDEHTECDIRYGGAINIHKVNTSSLQMDIHKWVTSDNNSDTICPLPTRIAFAYVIIVTLLWYYIMRLVFK